MYSYTKAVLLGLQGYTIWPRLNKCLRKDWAYYTFIDGVCLNE